MPHVTIKMFPGRNDDEKRAIAERITRALIEEIGSTEASISVAIEDVPSERWMPEVYQPEIAPKLDRLYKKPGYGP